jgi:hypothetical protein
VQTFEILRMVLDEKTIKKTRKYEKSRLKAFYADILVDLGSAMKFDFKEIKMPSGNQSVRKLLGHYATLSSK